MLKNIVVYILGKRFGQVIEVMITPILYAYRYFHVSNVPPGLDTLKDVELEIARETQGLARSHTINWSGSDVQDFDFVVICRGLFDLERNGVGRLLWAQACVLKELGFKVKVICEWHSRVEVSLSGIQIFGMRAKWFVGRHALPSFNASWAKRVEKEIAKLNPRTSVISTIAGLESFSIATKEPFRRNYLFLITDHLLHNGLESESFRLRKLLAAEKELLSRSNVTLIGDSNAIIFDLSVHLDLPSIVDRSKCMYLAVASQNLEISSMEVNENIVNFQKRNKYLVFVGRIGKRKNLRLLIDAWNLLMDKHPNFNKELGLLVLGSPGDDLKSIKCITRLESKQENVLWVKSFSDLDKRFALSKALATVISSDYESFGYVALESLKAGTPVVAPRVGGLPEVVGNGGRFFEAGDYQSLYLAIMNEIQGPTSKKEVTDQSRKFSYLSLAESSRHIFS